LSNKEKAGYIFWIFISLLAGLLNIAGEGTFSKVVAALGFFQTGTWVMLAAVTYRDSKK